MAETPAAHESDSDDRSSDSMGPSSAGWASLVKDSPATAGWPQLWPRSYSPGDLLHGNPATSTARELLGDALLSNVCADPACLSSPRHLRRETAARLSPRRASKSGSQSSREANQPANLLEGAQEGTDPAAASASPVTFDAAEQGAGDPGLVTASAGRPEGLRHADQCEARQDAAVQRQLISMGLISPSKSSNIDVHDIEEAGSSAREMPNLQAAEGFRDACEKEMPAGGLLETGYPLVAAALSPDGRLPISPLLV